MSAPAVFVDASGLVAALSEADAFHKVGREAWESLARGRGSLVTTDRTIAEVVSVLVRRATIELATATGRRLLDPRAPLEIIQPTRADAIAALDELDAERWRGLGRKRRPGFNDALSFVVMRRRGVRVAFAFDDHFRTAGFERIP